MENQSETASTAYVKQNLKHNKCSKKHQKFAKNLKIDKNLAAMQCQVIACENKWTKNAS